jgi:PAS domain S-box-containing protein
MSDMAEFRQLAAGTADALLAAASDAILTCAPDGTIRHWNVAAEGLFGFAPDSMIGMSLDRVFPAGPGRRLAEALATAERSRQVVCVTTKAAALDGRILDVAVRLAPIVAPDGTISGYCLAARTVPTPSQFDLALGRLVDCSQHVGHAFCEALVGAIAETLAVRTVLLAEIDPADPDTARTIAVWSDGAPAEKFDYPLRGSPCINVLGNSVCFHADDVAASFPDDTLLADMGARAYVGAPLRASDGRILGILAAIHDRPLDPDTRPDSILEIFSARAAAELEREATVTHNEYLGRLIEGSLSEVYIFDAKTLRFKLVNKGARDNLGYSMAELKTLTPLDLKPDFTPADLAELVAPLERGEQLSVSFRSRHLRKDGSLYPVEVRLQLITGFGAPVYFAAIEDITQRAAAETALRRTEARLRRLFQQSPAGIVETDTSGRMVLVNRTWCEMLGYTEDELLGMTIFDVTDPDSLELTQQKISQLMAGADGLEIEKDYRRKDGTRLRASSNASALRDEDGAFQGVAAVILDITERMRAEQKIRASELLLRRIMDGTLAFIGLLHPDGTLIDANAPALAAGGLGREDVVGRKFWDCYWWSHDPAVMDRLRAAVERAAQGSIVRYDELVRMQGDTRMTIDFMLSPVLGEDGSVQMLVPSGFDISERKRQEERIVNLMHEVNHRSKNLLTVVQSIARQMPKSAPEAFTEEFGKRLQALAACQDLLIRSGGNDVPLETLIRSQLMHFADLLGRRITLDGPHVTLTPSAAQTLGMAIYELTTNAAKYGALSNDAGQIRIAWTIGGEAPGVTRFALHWQERGGPVAAVTGASGFGSVVLEHLVGMTLDADAEFDLAADGVSWRLNCALHNLNGR